jgi:hypothetical protein
MLVADEKEYCMIQIQKIKFDRMMDIIKRAAKISCCLCRDDCLSCDAHDVLREFGIEK